MKIQNSEKGMALLITFLIMGIMVAIVLGVTVIILSEIDIVRTIGYSVNAIFAANTAIEKSLYYDRQVVLTGERGICDICTSCLNCTNCLRSGLGCADCTDCTITYNGSIGAETYTAKVIVQDEGDIYSGIGLYKGISRAIDVSGGTGGGTRVYPPTITQAIVVPRSVPEGIMLLVYATITPDTGQQLDPDSIVMRIQQPDEVGFPTEEPAIIIMSLTGVNQYQGVWIGPEGGYYVDISACDTFERCTEAENI